MTTNLDTLRKIAEDPGVTAGPWFAFDRGIGYEVHHASGYELNNGHRETFTKPDATHIATFDPPTVLALLSRLEQAEQEAKAAKGVITQHIAARSLETHRNVGIAVDEAVKAVVQLLIEDPTRRAREAEAAVARVRELATGDPIEYGWSEAMLAVLRALDGDQA